MTAPIENSLVTLRVVSPCEHGKEHPMQELPEGVSFSCLECRDSRGRPRSHEVTREKYPKEVRRR